MVTTGVKGDEMGAEAVLQTEWLGKASLSK